MLTGEILYFSAFQAARTYAKTALALNARGCPTTSTACSRMPAAFPGNSACTCRSSVITTCWPATSWSTRPTTIGSGWSTGSTPGLATSLFDLAGVSTTTRSRNPRSLALLAAYRGSIEECDLRDLRILKTMSSLREPPWAVIPTVALGHRFRLRPLRPRKFRGIPRRPETARIPVTAC